MQRASKKHTDRRKYSNVRRRLLETRYREMFVTRYTLKINAVTELDYRDHIDQVWRNLEIRMEIISGLLTRLREVSERKDA